MHPWRPKEGVSGLHIVVNHPQWILETELSSSGKAVSAFNSPACILYISYNVLLVITFWLNFFSIVGGFLKLTSPCIFYSTWKYNFVPTLFCVIATFPCLFLNVFIYFLIITYNIFDHVHSSSPTCFVFWDRFSYSSGWLVLVCSWGWPLTSDIPGSFYQVLRGGATAFLSF